jgi:hypothetical protein
MVPSCVLGTVGHSDFYPVAAPTKLRAASAARSGAGKGACVESWCTRALIYANGHVLDDETETLPAKNARFCPQRLGVPWLPAPDVGHRSATPPGSPIFAQQLLRHMTKQQLLKDSDHRLSPVRRGDHQTLQ